MNSPGNLGLDHEAEASPDPSRSNSQRGKSGNKSSYVYYRIYGKDGPIESSRAIYSNDRNIGRVLMRLIPPPHAVASVKRRLCKLEGLNAVGPSNLFISLSAEKPLGSATHLPLSGTGPGSSEREPMALVVESDERRVVGKSEDQPQVANTVPLRPTCPITHLYYRIFSEDEDVDVKTSFDEDDSSLGRINVLSITPPHTVAAIKTSVMKVEELQRPGVQVCVFEDSNSDEALDDGPVSLLGESFPGCNEANPMIFVYNKAQEVCWVDKEVRLAEDALAEFEAKQKREAERLQLGQKINATHAMPLMSNATSMPDNAIAEPKIEAERLEEGQKAKEANAPLSLSKTTAMATSKPKSQIHIAVMGASGSGKSTFINLASGSDLRVGHNVVSCTSTVDVSNPFYLDDREIVLYDTPGFNDTNLSETKILGIIAGELEKQYRNNRTLHGIIYVHKISDNRVGGLEKSNFSVFRKLCGDESLRNVVIVTNMWSLVRSKEDGYKRVRELETVDDFFKPALTKGARLMHHTEETAESALQIIRSILDNHPVPLDLQKELVDENRTIDKTSAGAEVDKKLAALAAQYEQKLKDQLEALLQAQKERDEETRQELLEEAQKARDAIAKLEAERKNQAKEYERFRNQLAEMEAERRMDIKRLEGEQEAKDAKNKVEMELLWKQLAEYKAQQPDGEQEAKDRKIKIEMERLRKQLAEMKEEQLAAAREAHEVNVPPSILNTAKPKILIAVVGSTGSGKSTFINLASGSDLQVGHSIISCTSTVDVAKPFYLDGREIVLYDTPGFDHASMSETKILQIIAEERYRKPRVLHGIIYVHRISDPPSRGKHDFDTFRKLCRDTSLRNVVVVTNMWRPVRSKEDGDRKVRELETTDSFLEPALAKGARLMHHTEETVESAHTIIRSILQNHPVPLNLQRPGRGKIWLMNKTSVGDEAGWITKLLMPTKSSSVPELAGLFL